MALYQIGTTLSENVCSFREFSFDGDIVPCSHSFGYSWLTNSGPPSNPPHNGLFRFSWFSCLGRFPGKRDRAHHPTQQLSCTRSRPASLRIAVRIITGRAAAQSRPGSGVQSRCWRTIDWSVQPMPDQTDAKQHRHSNASTLPTFRLPARRGPRLSEASVESEQGFEAASLSSQTTPTSKATSLPTTDDIKSIALQRGVVIDFNTLGPWFTVTARSEGPEDGAILGKVEGFVQPWIDGKILHLDSARVAKIDSSAVRSMFGIGLLIGAMAIRHGYDQGCHRAELLAINDTEEYHMKLVRYYTRLGFTPVYEVEGGSLQDMAHMLVWGGIGTRMNGNIESLLAKWSKVLRREEMSNHL